jgi:ribosomal protein L37AE/L43A
MVKTTNIKGMGKTPKPLMNKKKEVPSKSVSEFNNWFEEQFGKRPSNKSFESLRKDLESIAYTYNKTRAELAAIDVYETRKTAAHYAWIAMQSITEERKKEPYPVCPMCGNNENVIKNGTVERKGVKVQNWHCKECKKTW